MSRSDIDSTRWLRLSRAFDAALDLDADAQRDFVNAFAAEDAELGQRLRVMLEADRARAVVDTPVPVAMPHITAETEEAPPLPADSRLGNWRLVRPLARGAMGAVYVAERDDGSSQRAALKLLRGRWDGSLQAQRFLQERKILAQLSHPNIPQLIDHGLDADGRPWFTLEYVDGPHLLAWADRERLSLRERIDLFRQVCAAVQYAHQHFVVHRDLKPGNILVDAEGHPKVLDFGAAKRIDDVEGATLLGAFAGFTPEYAAPEQISGGPISAATDVYALGVILYQLLSGRLPYQIDHGNLRDVTATIVSRDPERIDRAFAHGDPKEVAKRSAARNTTPKAFRQFVRGDINRILQTALAKEPERRYASVGALSADLKCFLQDRPVSVSGDTFGYHARKFVLRNRWAVGMGTLAFAVTLAGLTGVAWQMRQTRMQTRLALQMKDSQLALLGQLVQSGDNRQVADNLLRTSLQQLDLLPYGSTPRLQLAEVISNIMGMRGYRQQDKILIKREMGPRLSGDGIDSAPALNLLNAWTIETLEDGNGTAGSEALDRAVAHYPRQHSLEVAAALAQLCRVELFRGRPEQALDYSRRALAIHERLSSDPSQLAYPRLELAAALVAARHTREGRAISEQTLASLPTTPSQTRQFALGMTALRRSLFGEFASADTLYQQAEAMQPSLPPGVRSIFLTYSDAVNRFDLGDLEGASQRLDLIDADTAAPNQPLIVSGFVGQAELLWLRGEIALARGQHQSAAKAFGHSVELLEQGNETGVERQLAYAQSLRAIALYQAGQRRDADAALKHAHALSQRPGVAGSYAQAMLAAAEAQGLRTKGDARAAVDGYDHALELLAAGRSVPIVLEFQLKENRDAVRFRLWRARALQAMGAGKEAMQAARAFGVSQLGAAHPFLRVAGAGAGMHQPNFNAASGGDSDAQRTKMPGSRSTTP